MNHNRVSATIGTRAVDPRTVDDNSVLKQMGCFRSNLQEQLSVMDAKLDSLLDMANNIQILVSKMNKERGLVEDVVGADVCFQPQITTEFGEKNQLLSPPTPTKSSNSIELMNKNPIQPEEKSEIEFGKSPLVLEGVARIVTIFSKDIGNSVFESESSKSNKADKFGFDSELSKNNNAQEVFDGLTNWNLKPPEEVAAFVDSKKDIYAHMKIDLYRVFVATSVEYFGKKCNEAMQVFDPGGSALDVRVLKVGDSLLEVFYASWLRIKWDSKKIYDWVWQSLFICSYVWQHNLLKCSGMNREIVLCIVTSKSNIFGLVGCNICWFKTTCLVLCSKNLLAVTPHARTRRICFYTFMELTVWKWLKDGIGTCLQIDSLSLARLCEICDSLFEMLPIWNKHLRSVKFKIMEPNPLEYCVVTPDFEIFCEGEPSKKKDENRMDEVCYDGVWGLRKQMARVRELVELPLRHPRFFKSIDDKPPMRILLYGPLESENTLIVANEMGVSFFVIYGHEIISNLAGEGENNLRGTFEEAEKNAPSIILIDEIYSIAPKRWKISGGILKSMTSEGETSLAKAIANEDSIATHRGSSSRDASGIADIKLNQLLIELDGLFENEGVHTMCRVMKMMLGFHSNIRITQSDLLVNILGEALRGWEFDHLLRWIILGNEHMVHNLLAGRDPILISMHQRPPSKPPFQFLHPSLGDKTHSRGEYCHVHGYDGIGNKERRREINGSVGVLIMLGLDLIVFLCY